jgi:formylglycine-generating enzyme required for sulfatase activity
LTRREAADRGAGGAIRPASYRPPEQRARRRRPMLRGGAVLLAAVALLLGVGVWFVFSAEAVRIEIEPQAERLAVRGGFSVPVGERRLMRPGNYVAVAEKTGYERLEAPFTVTAGATHVRLSMTPLPGRLSVRSEPEGALLRVDDERVGTTPLDDVLLAPGRHTLSLEAPRHVPHEQEVEIEGRDIAQRVEIALTPAWAPVTVHSKPAGAELHVDGEPAGTTPLTTEIDAGTRRLSLHLEGYQTWERVLEAAPDEAQELDLVELERMPGRVAVRSTPSNATVTVDGDFAGRTPLTLAVRPDRAQTLHIAKAGYESLSRSVMVASGEEQALEVELAPVSGEVHFRATPEDAQLYIDGEPRGRANQTLRLPSIEHEVEIRKAGYAPFRRRITPLPEAAQTVRAELLTEEEARFAHLPQTLDTAAGQRMRLIRPGRFTMGAPRREQGRRANEIQREVELTRAFYLSVHEITNAEFRAFRPNHSAGIVNGTTLDNDNQPVVRVGWNDAVAYANWLSEQEGLPTAYENGQLVRPHAGGYRLPTEAEWEYAARFAGGRAQRYPWGDSMPPSGRAGNFADRSARAILSSVLENYDDGFAASAPVGRFAANALGLHDMGGNVAEWMTDVYAGEVEIVPSRQVDPVGTGSGPSRAVRGASWRSASITELRLSFRDHSSEPRDDLGFRLARSAEE